MAVTSRGRGLAAALGLFCLFVGLVGGAVLYLVAQRRPAQTVEGFARAPVGCVTTLEFAETGTFYVFEEVGADIEAIANGCEPAIDPTARFDVVFTGALRPEVIADGVSSVSYDVAGFDGRSVQQLEITAPGQYTIEVTGDDPTVAAAIGRDPDAGVDDLQRAASILAIAGTVLGLLLLIVSGRRSKRAATVMAPSGPGWGPTPRATGEPTIAGGPISGQVPVNPHAPSGPPAWQPPSGEAADDTTAPAVPPLPATPASPADAEPVLPDTPGRTSGT
jgi:hypothetical protein